MSAEISLINLGEISEPAKVLIEKISEGLGGYFKPYQIKRVAKAEAEAEIIKAKAQIEVTDLQRRALGRFVVEEAKKQDNIEKITEKAIPQLENSATPQDVEDDWITNFLDKCRIISDDEMQSLWAKVLAGESNSPGSYSKRTVNFLGSLDKGDARLFTALCGFAWLLGDVVPLIYGFFEEPIYNDQHIDFNTLSHLDDIGLVNFDAVASFERVKLPKKAIVAYYGINLNVDFKKESDNRLELGNILLTAMGQQLAPISGSKPVDGFQDYVINKWANKGLILSSTYPKSK